METERGSMERGERDLSEKRARKYAAGRVRETGNGEREREYGARSRGM